jgi:hypothetical protein
MRSKILFSILGLISAGLTANGVFTPALANDYAIDLVSLQDNVKILICHVPPGNPDNAHEISVDESAVDKHLAHGDTRGPCVT